MRRPLLFLAAFVALAGLAVSGGWFYARYMALEAVDDWVAAQQARGTDIGWAQRDVTGWPLRLDGLFTAPFATIRAPGRTVTWRGPDAAVRFYILAPGTIDLAAPGRHRVTLDQDGDIRDFTLDAATLDARTDSGLDGRAGGDISAGATGLTLTGPGDAPVATAKAMQLFWQQPAGAAEPLAPSLRSAVRIDALSLAPGMLPATSHPVLGNDIAVLRGEITVNGAIDPHLPALAGLTTWRDIGGTIDLARFELVWGPVRMVGDGTLALDSALQPEGAFTARISGLADILTAMENASMIDARTAAIARITLAVLTRPSEDGGPPAAHVPLTIQNQTLSVGPVTLMKLPTITWR